MKTTLRKIRKNQPCREGWKKLLSNVDNDLDKDLSIKEILKSNGIKDAAWALRAVYNQKSVRLFCADVAESVLYIFEEKHPEDKRPRLAIKASRDFANGLIDKEELDTYCTHAAAATDAAYIAAYAAYAAAHTAAYPTAAYAAAYTATYAAAAYAAAADAARISKWEEIEKMLLKYL